MSSKFDLKDITIQMNNIQNNHLNIQKNHDNEIIKKNLIKSCFEPQQLNQMSSFEKKFYKEYPEIHSSNDNMIEKHMNFYSNFTQITPQQNEFKRYKLHLNNLLMYFQSPSYFMNISKNKKCESQNDNEISSIQITNFQELYNQSSGQNSISFESISNIDENFNVPQMDLEFEILHNDVEDYIFYD